MSKEASGLYAAKDFETVWVADQAAHDDPRVRAAHALATAAAGGVIAAAVVIKSPRLALAAPVVAYVLAQSSHRLANGTKTVPWRRPAWHLRAELRLFRGTVRELVKLARAKRYEGAN